MTAETVKVLTVTQESAPICIPAVQSDTGRVLSFALPELTIPSEATAQIYIKKPSGAMIYNSCTINSNDGTSVVSVQLTSKSIDEGGVSDAQIRIISGDDILTSFEFQIDVKNSIVDDSAVEGTSEFTALEEAMQTIESTVATANAAKETAESAQAVANAAKETADACPPTNHATAEDTYGCGTTVKFGHCKTINNLTRNALKSGEALSAYQGYLLNQNKLSTSGGSITGNLSVSGTLSIPTGGTLSIDGSTVSDYIVAQGTSGKWRYWKYNSGLAVCIHDSIENGNFNNNQSVATWGGWYDLPEYTFSAYPFTFSAAPAVYISRTTAHPDTSTESYNDKFVFIAMTGGSTTSPPRADIARPTFSVIGGPQLSLVAIGRWK